jgi:O-antigen ligase
MALLAVLAPTLLAHHEPPSVTFFNQALAVFGWGLFVAVLGQEAPQAGPTGAAGRSAGALAVVLAICCIEAFGSGYLWGHLAAGLALMGAGMSLAALLSLWAGWRAGRSLNHERIAEAFFGALAAAGAIGMVLAIIQVFAPSLADGNLVAEPTMPGRAVGNLRQPNHFSTLLVFACSGAAWLGARRRLPAWLASGLITFYIWGIVLTASRTGMIGMAFLLAWGLVDKRLPVLLRWTLLGAPVLYGLFWGGMYLLAHMDSHVTFAAEARLHDKSDISSSRFKIWANVFELIRQHPWWGVGYGEFNVAWTFTPFPTRPIAFFDHTHNLPLQWAVEFGLPLTILMTGLLMLAYKTLLAGMRSGAPQEADTAGLTTLAACCVMVTIAGLHSLLEYPLWYSYFLLPTAFAWGLGLAVQPHRAPSSAPAAPGAGLMLAGLLMAAASLWCTIDYLRGPVSIYAPRQGAGPLEQRIANGMRNIWWGYQADYAYVTTPEEDEPSLPPQAFQRTLHNLVDARLMIAYARSLAEHGQIDQARYVVQRLKEFRNAMGDSFLAVCKAQPEEGDERPFQCDPPTGHYTWRQLLP